MFGALFVENQTHSLLPASIAPAFYPSGSPPPQDDSVYQETQNENSTPRRDGKEPFPGKNQSRKIAIYINCSIAGKQLTKSS
jgi:hypothetical protein